MILRNIKLHNYRQHADLNVKLDGTIIAVVGPNGSGKSNLLGAIQFAFTGEQTGFKKSDLLRWGADEGEVTVTFEHNGIQGEISRAMHSSSANLKFGKDTYRGATAVAEALKSQLDMDKDLVKQAVFVRQAEIDAILFTDPAVREKSFQRLMGIGDATKIHKVMGDVLSELGDLPNYDEQIAEGKRRYVELNRRLCDLQGQLKTMQTQRETVPPLDAIKQSITSLHAQIQAMLRVTAADNAVTQHNSVVKLTQDQLAALAPVTYDLADIDSKLEALRVRGSDTQRYRQVSDAWKTAGEALIALGQPTIDEKEITDAQETYQSLSAEMNKVLGELQLHDNLRKALQSGTSYKLETCPVCGSTIQDKDKLFARLTAAISDMQTKVQNMKLAETSARTTLDSKRSTLTQYQKTYTARMAAYEQADKALKATKEANDDLTALNAEIINLQGMRKALLEYMTKRTSLESKLSTETRHHTVLEQELATALSAIATFGFPINCGVDTLNGSLKQAEQQRDAAQQLDTELARLNGTVSELSKTLNELDKTVASLEYKRSTQQTYKDTVATLSRVRDWFHYSNGPHTLSTSVLDVMNQDVNKFLGQFTAPFTVEPSSAALGFVCNFTDGRSMPSDGYPDASMLSGGQKIQLAVAFRFASYCMFASKLGMLSLDEPTAYLDDSNIGRFCELLQQIKRVAQGMNLQVFLATHEQSVVQFCDTVIDLKPTL